MWVGERSGSKIEGTLTWVKEGQAPVEYSFKGEVLPSLYERLGEVYGIALFCDRLIDVLDEKDAHAALNISEADWSAMASDFSALLNEMNVPAEEQAELYEIVAPTKPGIVVAGK